MTFYLNIFSLLCIVFAVYKIHKGRRADKWDIYTYAMDRHHGNAKFLINFTRELQNKTEGRYQKTEISAKIAEKMAERAFNLASSANLGVVALQKALVIPRLLTKQQVKQNQLAKKQVDELFSSEGSFDWLRPILSDEDNEILDEIERKKQSKMNGEHNT